MHRIDDIDDGVLWLPGSSEMCAGTSFSSPASSSKAVPELPSIAAPGAARLLSNPAVEYNWDFQRATCNPVRVLLQVWHC
jgi:hypothetical protein